MFRDSFQEFLLQNSWARGILIKLSPSLLNDLAGSSYVGAIKINTRGEVLDYIKEDTSEYAYLSTAMEFKDNLYLASFAKPAIAILPLVGPTIKPVSE